MADDKKLYDQEQVDSLVVSAVDKTVGEVTAELDKELVSVRAELAQAQELLTETKSELEKLHADIAEKDEATRLVLLGDERAESVSEVATFTDDELEDRKARWAAMSAEDFEVTLEDFRTIAKAASKTSEKEEKKVTKKTTEVALERDTASDDEDSEPVASFLGTLN